MAIQSVIFNKNVYSKPQAINWLRKHGFKTSYTQTINFWRFRQTDPEQYKNYINKDIAKGIIYVIGY